MKKKDFVGTSNLLRLALRRDRIKLLAWVLGIALFILMAAAAYTEMSLEEMQSVAALRIANPGTRIFDGTLAAVETLGQFTFFRIAIVAVVLFSLMSFQTVMRHTRHNEETGCAELLGANVLGRYAPLSAALLVTVAANLLIGFLIGLALTALEMPAAGSFAAGFGFAGVGIVFAGIGAVTAQLAGSGREANGMAGGILGLAVLVNAIGSMLGEVRADNLGLEASWPAWLSPVGWVSMLQPYNQENWWVLLLFAALFAACTAAAFALIQHRDIGGGILPARRGPASAPRSLRNPLGLAWRLQRGTFVAWAVAVGVLGLVFGAVSTEFGEALENVELAKNLGITAEMVMHSLVGFVASLIGIYAITALLRMRAEESGALESVLATPVSRSRWLFSHLLCSALGALLLIFTFVIGMLLSEGSFTEVWGFFKTGLYQWIPILSLVGLSLAAYGLWPRRVTLVAWLGMMAALVGGPIVGPMINAPDFLRKISPFHHIPLVTENIEASAVAVLLTLAFGLAGLGFVAFKGRSLDL